MARVELSRTYPIELKKAWDYLNDPRHWTEWYTNLIEVMEPEASWTEPGDGVPFIYRLLGRKVEGRAVLAERHFPDLVRFTAELSGGLPDVHQEWRHVDLGNAITTTVVLETEEPGSFFGKAIDRMVIPRALERDLRRTLEHLDDIFALGLHE